MTIYGKRFRSTVSRGLTLSNAGSWACGGFLSVPASNAVTCGCCVVSHGSWPGPYATHAPPRAGHRRCKHQHMHRGREVQTARGCPPGHSAHPRVCQSELATGLVCTPYLESCPRIAPLGKVALWMLT